MTPIRPRPSRRLPLVAPLLALVVASCLALGPASPARPAGKATTSTIDVRVMGQGAGIPGVRVTVAPDSGGEPEMWNSTRAPALGVQRTDSTGHTVFKDVPPGRYLATTSCFLPGNWIAGNYATRLEVLPGRPAAVVLTARRGGMVVGRALQGDVPPRGCTVRADSPDALMSGCGMMTPSVVDTLTGEFTVTKVPVGAVTWIKAGAPLGNGELGVWRDFRFNGADTMKATIEFPRFAPGELSTALISVRTAAGKNVEQGSVQLLQVQRDGTWRYEVTVNVGGADSVTKITQLPPGDYQVRATPGPGTKAWWTAPLESLSVKPGGTTRRTVAARLRT